MTGTAAGPAGRDFGEVATTGGGAGVGAYIGCTGAGCGGGAAEDAGFRSRKPSWSDSRGNARIDSFGGRSARRSVVFRSAVASRSTCFGVSASVTVVRF